MHRTRPRHGEQLALVSARTVFGSADRFCGEDGARPAVKGRACFATSGIAARSGRHQPSCMPPTTSLLSHQPRSPGAADVEPVAAPQMRHRRGVPSPRSPRPATPQLRETYRPCSSRSHKLLSAQRRVAVRPNNPTTHAFVTGHCGRKVTQTATGTMVCGALGVEQSERQLARVEASDARAEGSLVQRQCHRLGWPFSAKDVVPSQRGAARRRPAVAGSSATRTTAAISRASPWSAGHFSASHSLSSVNESNQRSKHASP